MLTAEHFLYEKSEKHVSWDASIISCQDTSDTLFVKPKVPNHRLIKGLLLTQIADSNKQGGLAEDFIKSLEGRLGDAEITDDILLKFLAENAQENINLLYRAVLFFKGTLLLHFLYKKNPDITKMTLKDKNFYILKKFIAAQRGLGKLGYYSVEDRQARIEKWTVLLHIAKEDIQAFMENSENQSFISQQARGEFQIALNELESTATIAAAENALIKPPETNNYF